MVYQMDQQSMFFYDVPVNLIPYNLHTKSPSLKKDFGEFRPGNVIDEVNQDFVSDERVVWLDIEGVPLYAWSRKSFDKIGNKWGEVLNIEDSYETSFG
ncbi:hypothetical protein Tco_1421635, partial [Tanacetum coccineum]